MTPRFFFFLREKMSTRLKKIISDDHENLFQNYGERLPVCFVRGEGSNLYDQDGREYIDFLSGIAVSSLGYGHRALARALHDQVDSIIHSSNWFFNREQNRAAGLLNELAFPGRSLFVNSGTEANEAAIKLARRYGLSRDKKRLVILSFSNSFHGRTYGSMAATAQKKIQDGFGPMPNGFIHLPYNDIKALKREIKGNKKITAVMVEMIQGEGGILPADKGFVTELARLCSRNDILLIVDEIQTGVGRTGALFAYQHYGVIPDIITLAKGLGGGVPIGALHAKNFLVEHLPRGAHGTTFGGNHLAAAAASAVLKEVSKPSFLKNVNTVSEYIFKVLNAMKQKYRIIRDIRGMGLHIGIELTVPGINIVREGLNRGLVLNCTAERVVRIMPPLTIPMRTAKKGMSILDELINEENASAGPTA